jgi:hypothetical protein
MGILVKIIAIFFLSWILLSPPLLLYYLFSKNKNTRIANLVNSFSYSLFVGTLFSFTAIIGYGLSELLVFIPDSWGFVSDDGEYKPYRKYISHIISLPASIGILFVLEGYNSYKKENIELKEEIEALKKRIRSRKKSNMAVSEKEEKK